MGSLIPFIIEKTPNGERGCDIFSRLLKDRIVFIGDEIDDEMASTVIAQLLFLSLETREADIHLYIMSPGGSISAGLAIYDTMQHVVNDVCTYCIGQAASMGAFLLAAGAKGKRFALPSSRIMLHQPWGGVHGDATDIQIEAREMEKIKRMLYERLAKHTGKSAKQIERDTERDFWMSANEAKKYGVIDKVYDVKKGPVKMPDTTPDDIS